MRDCPGRFGLRSWIVLVACASAVFGIGCKEKEPTTPEEVANPMVRIPGGKFLMGSEDGASDEMPAHEVEVASFELDQGEVTARQYLACVRAGKCAQTHYRSRCEPLHREGAKEGERGDERRAMTCVEASQAEAFCRWMGKRLPTEEEWEYAARGMDGRKYPWGNEDPVDPTCWKNGRRPPGACPAVILPSEGLHGLRDMGGNVTEWTSSGHSAEYGKPQRSDFRVARGGSRASQSFRELRATYRNALEPKQSGGWLGIRCAR